MEECLAHNLGRKPRTGDVKTKEVVDFSSLLLSDAVLSGLRKAGFERPSPIQLKAIPLGRCGLDLVIQAKSGTGKTCVFAVTSLESIDLEASSTQVLILAPTREIAVQIWEVITSLASALPDLRCYTFIGGLPVADDVIKLKKCHIAVGTPGRIKQLIEKQALITESVRLFVLDEADKLLEQGFQDGINWIYSSLPENKQMLALSATYPEALAQQLTSYMRNPTFVRLNTSDPALLGIRQYYQEVPFHPLPQKAFEAKCEALLHLLTSVSFQQCLVFSNYQLRAQSLSDVLNAKGWPATFISGSQEQQDRLTAMAKLKKFKCRVLISTDLTSRGIDAENVNLVVNLDIPYDHETYLHRIGRAGRFGTYGAGVTFASLGKEMANLKTMEKAAKTRLLRLPDPIPADLARSSGFVDLEHLVTAEKMSTDADGSEITSLQPDSGIQRPDAGIQRSYPGILGSEDNISANKVHAELKTNGLHGDHDNVMLATEPDAGNSNHAYAINGTHIQKDCSNLTENRGEEKLLKYSREDLYKARQLGLKVMTDHTDRSNPQYAELPTSDAIPALIDRLSEDVQTGYDEAELLLEGALQGSSQSKASNEESALQRTLCNSPGSDIENTKTYPDGNYRLNPEDKSLIEEQSTLPSVFKRGYYSPRSDNHGSEGEEAAESPGTTNNTTGGPGMEGFASESLPGSTEKLTPPFGMGPLFTKQINKNIEGARKILSGFQLTSLADLEPRKHIENLIYKDLLADLTHFRKTGAHIEAPATRPQASSSADIEQRKMTFAKSLEKVSEYLHQLTLTVKQTEDSVSKAESLKYPSHQSEDIVLVDRSGIRCKEGTTKSSECVSNNPSVLNQQDPVESFNRDEPVSPNASTLLTRSRVPPYMSPASDSLSLNTETCDTVHSKDQYKGARPKESRRGRTSDPIKSPGIKTKQPKRKHPEKDVVIDEDRLLGVDYMRRLASCLDQDPTDSADAASGEEFSGTSSTESESESSESDSDTEYTESDADDESEATGDHNYTSDPGPNKKDDKKYDVDYRKSKWEAVRTDCKPDTFEEGRYGPQDLYDPSQPWNQTSQGHDPSQGQEEDNDAPPDPLEGYNDAGTYPSWVGHEQDPDSGQQAWNGVHYNPNRYHYNQYQAEGTNKHMWGSEYYGPGNTGPGNPGCGPYPYGLWMQCTQLLGSLNAMQAYQYSMYCQQQLDYHKKWADHYQREWAKRNRFQREFHKQKQNIDEMSRNYRTQKDSGSNAESNL